jgi:gas vesicle protein
MTGFFIGLFIGAALGFVIAALLSIGKDSDPNL